jgi:hypothetical protein
MAPVKEHNRQQQCDLLVEIIKEKNITSRKDLKKAIFRRVVQETYKYDPKYNNEQKSAQLQALCRHDETYPYMRVFNGNFVMKALEVPLNKDP